VGKKLTGGLGDEMTWYCIIRCTGISVSARLGIIPSAMASSLLEVFPGWRVLAKA
jgi:hypothetical protein